MLLHGASSPTVRPRGGVRRLALLALAGVGAVVVLLAVIRALPDLDIFGSETVDRSQPAVLRSIERLSDYHAATANLQVVVDVEEDAKLLPSFIKGEKWLFVAAGNVDAGVDFSHLGADAVQVDEDRTAATITLPAAQLYEARVDPARSRVFDRERGLLDRIGSAFGADADKERQLFVLAEKKLAEAARSDPGLLRSAERNTRAMLEGMLGGLGFERVTVRFVQPQT